MKAYSLACFSAVVAVCLIVGAGLGLWILSYQPDNLIGLVEKIAPHLRKLGALITIMGFSLAFLFHKTTSFSAYSVELNSKLKISLKKKAISQFLDQFFIDHPQFKVSRYNLVVGKKRLEIIADLSHMSIEEHESWLNEIEPKLITSMKNHLILPKKVDLTIAVS